jgi:hypothetical protein
LGLALDEDDADAACIALARHLELLAQEAG